MGFRRAAVFAFLLAFGVLDTSAADNAVARELTPWWKTDSVEGIAAVRREGVNPAQWSEQEAIFRTLHIAGNQGNFKERGKVRVLDIFAKAGLVHYPEDSGKFNESFYVTYEVVEPVPDIKLISDGGSAGWLLLNYNAFSKRQYGSKETWLVDQKGVFSVDARFGGWAAKGYSVEKGVHELLYHTGFQLYRVSTNQWVDICNLSSTQEKTLGLRCLGIGSIESVVNDTRFTVANLTKYTLAIAEIASDWKPDGFVGVRLVVTDADGATFGVPGAEMTATVMSAKGRHESATLDMVPVKAIFPDGTKWGFKAAMPGVFWEPATIEVTARVRVVGPDGVLRTEELKRTLSRKETDPIAADKWLAPPPRPELRTKDGKLIESRVFACGGKILLDNPSPVSKLEGRQKHEWLVDLARKGNANILAFLVLANGWSYVPSDIIGTRTHVPKDYDNLKLMVDRAHSYGMEAQIWICYAHGGWDPAQAPQVLALHPEWTARNADGSPTGRGVADIHRPGYRELMVRYTADLVKRYPVDGVLLDYIRTMAVCYCEECRKEYKAKYQRDLIEDGTALAPKFIEWQRDAVEAGVKDIREALNKIRPGLKLSAFVGSPPSDKAKNVQGQSTCAEWLEKGWVDALMPMLYDADMDGNVLQWQDYALTSKRPDRVWPTMRNYLKAYSVKESETTAEVSQRNPDGSVGAFVTGVEGLALQYRTYRNSCHIRGITIFDLENETEKHIDSIAKDLWVEPASPYWGAPDE